MPEGAEVRINRDMLATTVEGQVLLELKPLSGKLERNGILGFDEFSKFLPSKIAKVTVRGKSLLVLLENGAAIHSTLGMAGWWYPVLPDYNKLTGKAYANGALHDISTTVGMAYKHARVILKTDQRNAVFCDMRNFGNMTCYTPEQLAESNPLRKLGVDLLNEAPTFINWAQHWASLKKEASKSRQNKSIGELLLDQEFACGLGNIYRAEVLFLARLNPNRKLCELTDQEWAKIGILAPLVLNIAYDTQGTMEYNADVLKKYLDYHISDDFIYKGHLVYGRKTDPRSNTILSDRLGSRTMWWCPEMQT